MNDILKNAPKNPAAGPSVALNPLSASNSFYLISDGCRIGPFIATGPLDHLESMLRIRGVRISA